MKGCVLKMLEFIGLTLSIMLAIISATIVLTAILMSPVVMGWYIKKSFEMTNKMAKHMFKEEETN